MNIKKLIVLSILTIVILLALSGYAWVNLPDDAQIPIHWNMAGEVDRYATKLHGLFIMPVIVAVISLLFRYLPKLEPRRQNLEQSPELFASAWIMLLIVLSVAHGATVSIALGYLFPIKEAMTTSVAVTLIMVGNFLGKSKSMFFIGVRTPWTLSSETTWNKSNRLLGKLMVLIGLGTVLALMVGVEASLSLMVMVILLLTSAIFILVYSYYVWHKEQKSM